MVSPNSLVLGETDAQLVSRRPDYRLVLHTDGARRFLLLGDSRFRSRISFRQLEPSPAHQGSSGGHHCCARLSCLLHA
jgi:hypothetical protein